MQYKNESNNKQEKNIKLKEIKETIQYKLIFNNYGFLKKLNEIRN